MDRDPTLARRKEVPVSSRKQEVGERSVVGVGNVFVENFAKSSDLGGGQAMIVDIPDSCGWRVRIIGGGR